MATKQKIRGVIDTYADDSCLYPDEACEYRSTYGYCISGDDDYKCLMKRLGELGVVIKVDKELPDWLEYAEKEYQVGFRDGLNYYEAVEPLI